MTIRIGDTGAEQVRAHLASYPALGSRGSFDLPAQVDEMLARTEFPTDEEINELARAMASSERLQLHDPKAHPHYQPTSTPAQDQLAIAKNKAIIAARIHRAGVMAPRAVGPIPGSFAAMSREKRTQLGGEFQARTGASTAPQVDLTSPPSQGDTGQVLKDALEPYKKWGYTGEELRAVLRQGFGSTFNVGQTRAVQQFLERRLPAISSAAKWGTSREEAISLVGGIDPSLPTKAQTHSMARLITGARGLPPRTGVQSGAPLSPKQWMEYTESGRAKVRGEQPYEQGQPLRPGYMARPGRSTQVPIKETFQATPWPVESGAVRTGLEDPSKLPKRAQQMIAPYEQVFLRNVPITEMPWRAGPTAKVPERGQVLRSAFLFGGVLPEGMSLIERKLGGLVGKRYVEARTPAGFTPELAERGTAYKQGQRVQLFPGHAGVSTGDWPEHILKSTGFTPGQEGEPGLVQAELERRVPVERGVGVSMHFGKHLGVGADVEGFLGESGFGMVQSGGVRDVYGLAYDVLGAIGQDPAEFKRITGHDLPEQWSDAATKLVDVFTGKITPKALRHFDLPKQILSKRHLEEFKKAGRVIGDPKDIGSERYSATLRFPGLDLPVMTQVTRSGTEAWRDRFMGGHTLERFRRDAPETYRHIMAQSGARYAPYRHIAEAEGATRKLMPPPRNVTQALDLPMMSIMAKASEMAMRATGAKTAEGTDPEALRSALLRSVPKEAGTLEFKSVDESFYFPHPRHTPRVKGTMEWQAPTAYQRSYADLLRATAERQAGGKGAEAQYQAAIFRTYKAQHELTSSHEFTRKMSGAFPRGMHGGVGAASFANLPEEVYLPTDIAARAAGITLGGKEHKRFAKEFEAGERTVPYHIYREPVTGEEAATLTYQGKWIGAHPSEHLRNLEVPVISAEAAQAARGDLDKDAYVIMKAFGVDLNTAQQIADARNRITEAAETSSAGQAQKQRAEMAKFPDLPSVQKWLETSQSSTAIEDIQEMYSERMRVGGKMGSGFNIQQKMMLAAKDPVAHQAAEQVGGLLYMQAQDFQEWTGSLRTLAGMSMATAKGGTLRGYYDPVGEQAGRFEFGGLGGATQQIIRNVLEISQEYENVTPAHAAALVTPGDMPGLRRFVTGAFEEGDAVKATAAIERAMGGKDAPLRFMEETTFGRLVGGPASARAEERGREGVTEKLTGIGKALGSVGDIGRRGRAKTMGAKLRAIASRRAVGKEPSSPLISHLVQRLGKQAQLSPEQVQAGEQKLQTWMAQQAAAPAEEALIPAGAAPPAGPPPPPVTTAIPEAPEPEKFRFNRATADSLAAAGVTEAWQTPRVTTARAKYDAYLNKAYRQDPEYKARVDTARQQIAQPAGPGGGGMDAGAGGDAGQPVPAGEDPAGKFAKIQWPTVRVGELQRAVKEMEQRLKPWGESVEDAAKGTQSLTKEMTQTTGRMVQHRSVIERATREFAEGREFPMGLMAQATQLRQAPSYETVTQMQRRVDAQWWRQRGITAGGERPEGGPTVGERMTGLGRGILSGWELMRMQRMWSMTGAPTFQQFVPAAAQAGLAGWQAAGAVGGWQGAGPSGVAGALMTAQATQRQGMIEAGRAGHQAWGPTLPMMGLLQQGQAVFGPAAGAGLMAGGAAGLLGFSTATAAGVGMGVGLPLAAIVGARYALGTSEGTAENQFAELRRERETAGQDFLSYLTSTKSWTEDLPRVMGFGMRGRTASTAMREMRAEGRGMEVTPLGELGQEMRGSAIRHIALSLRGQGGAWANYDTGQIAQMIQNAAPYLPELQTMSVADIIANPPELLRIMGESGVDPSQFTQLASQLHMGAFGAAELATTIGRLPQAEQVQAKYTMGKWAPAQAWGVSGQDILSAAVSPFETETQRAGVAAAVPGAAQRLREILPTRFKGLVEQYMPQVRQMVEGAPLAAGDLSRVGEARLGQMAGMMEQARMLGIAPEEPEQLTEEWVNQQYQQFPQVQRRLETVQRFTGMGAAPEAAVAAMQSAEGAGGMQGLMATGRFLQGDQFTMSMMGQANLGQLAGEPGGVGDMMRDSVVAALEKVIPSQYFDSVVEMVEGLRPTVEADTGLKMGTTQMYRGFAQEWQAGGGVIPSTVDQARFGRYAQMAEEGGLRALGVEERGLQQGYEDWQFGQQQRQLTWRGVSQFGGEFEGFETRGSFEIQRSIRSLSRIFEDFTRNFNEAQRGLAREHFTENWQVRAERMPVQFQRRREDLAFQGAQASLQFGWQMEDVQENLRFATGRDRRRLLRQQERATISYGMQMGQLDTAGQRLGQDEQWAQEDLERQKRQFEERFALQDDYQERYRLYIEQRRQLEDELQDVHEFGARLSIEMATEQLAKQRELREELRAIQQVVLAINETSQDNAAAQQQMINTVSWMIAQFGDNGSATTAWQAFVDLIVASLADAGGQAELVLDGRPPGGGGEW